MSYTNSDLSEILKSYADLLELHEGNPFKVKSYAAASFRIDKIREPLAGMSLADLEQKDGIGKGIAQKLHELFSTGTLKELEDLMAATPEGVRDIMRIKGLGPKKVAVIWKQMGVTSVGELLYACRENRLAQFKGFGMKTQDAVIKQIEFMMRSAGKFHYAKVFPVAHAFLKQLKIMDAVEEAEFAGDFRRKMEVVSDIEILIATQAQADVFNAILAIPGVVNDNDKVVFLDTSFRVHFCDFAAFGNTLVELTGPAAHLDALVQMGFGKVSVSKTEQEVYQSLNLAFPEPECRDLPGIISIVQEGRMPELIRYEDLQGSLHNHSEWSDGMNTISEMAAACMAKGYTYLGMADHSKSAQYANGLSEERVLNQQAEINALNEKYGGSFRVFSGIESDILYDGQLDYSDEVLKTFDYVVASVHSVLTMTEEKAMSRLIRAIENPYTTILGHPTGRLLLMREGYPVNFKKLIDACAANGVIMELNANPYRLDIDWRQLEYALEKGLWISINPDAHEVDGFDDMFFGVEVARKGLLTKERCFNAQSVEFVSGYFTRKRG